MENESNNSKKISPDEQFNPNLQYQNGDLVDQGESSNSRSTNEESTNVHPPLDATSSTISHVDPAGTSSTNTNASRSNNPLVCDACHVSFRTMFPIEELNDHYTRTMFPGFVAELTRCIHNVQQGVEHQSIVEHQRIEFDVEDIILAQAAFVLSDLEDVYDDYSDEEYYAGLTEDTIFEHLRSYVHAQTNISEPNTDQKSCCICLQEFHNGDSVGVLDCGHEYHYDCIKRWLLEKNRCPLCKIRGLFV